MTASTTEARMASTKTPSRKQAPAPPGSGAYGRTRQFAISRGLPPPDTGPPSADAPAPAPTKKTTKRPAKG